MCMHVHCVCMCDICVCLCMCVRVCGVFVHTWPLEVNVYFIYILFLKLISQFRYVEVEGNGWFSGVKYLVEVTYSGIGWSWDSSFSRI